MQLPTMYHVGGAHVQPMHPFWCHTQQVNDETGCGMAAVDGTCSPVLCDACVVVCRQKHRFGWLLRGGGFMGG